MSAWRLPLKRADRVIVGSVLGSLALVWALLVGFDAFLQFARQLGQLGRNGYTLASAAIYILYSIPRRIVDLFGNAALIGALLGLGGLAAGNELTALRAAGMSRLRIGAAVLALVALLGAGVLLLAEYAMPPAEQHATAIQLALRASNIAATTSSGLWTRDGDSIVNVKSALAVPAAHGTDIRLRDVRIYRLDAQGRLLEVRWAADAEFRGGHWMLDQVRDTRFDAAGAQTSTAAQAVWDTHIDPRLLRLSVLDPESQSIRDLLRNIRYLGRNGQNPQAYADALWQRLFYPFDVLLLVLCVLPLAFGALRAGGFGKRLLSGLLIAIAWFFVQRALINLGTVYGMSAWLANALPLLLLAAVATLVHRRTT